MTEYPPVLWNPLSLWNSRSQIRIDLNDPLGAAYIKRETSGRQLRESSSKRMKEHASTYLYRCPVQMNRRQCTIAKQIVDHKGQDIINSA